MGEDKRNEGAYIVRIFAEQFVRPDSATYRLQIYADGISKVRPGTYRLTSPVYQENSTIPHGDNSWFAYYSDKAGAYYSDMDLPGEITFTRVDFEAGIISGTFSFVGKNPLSGDKVTVSDGRFDIKMDAK